jgi:hypothetical protein
MADSKPSFDRSFVNIVNFEKIATGVDFATAEYIAHKTFFAELSSIQNQILAGGKVKLLTGQEIDMNSTGGLVGLQLYMETLEQSKQAMKGLAQLGLKTENTLWSKFQN